MVGIMVVNVPLRNWGGILGTWYLVGLVTLKSLVEIPRAVILAIHKSQESGQQEWLDHFQEG